MKYFLLLALAFLVGCENTAHRRDSDGRRYTMLTVTDPTGDLISEWIAEGYVKRFDQGYTIHAVQRRSGQPYPVESRYPNGRTASVVGPNIILEDIEKPAWLKDLDGE